jgi:hypothetical protein
MKITFRPFGGRVSLSAANELWFNDFANGDRFTYFFGAGKYRVRDGEVEANVYTLHAFFFVVRIFGRIKRAG